MAECDIARISILSAEWITCPVDIVIRESLGRVALQYFVDGQERHDPLTLKPKGRESDEK